MGEKEASLGGGKGEVQRQSCKVQSRAQERGAMRQWLRNSGPEPRAIPRERLGHSGNETRAQKPVQSWWQAQNVGPLCASLLWLPIFLTEGSAYNIVEPTTQDRDLRANRRCNLTLPSLPGRAKNTDLATSPASFQPSVYEEGAIGANQL